ncbi:MAG: type II toxin-antitoxin system HicB family antitoxin [Chloroflexota bacterium]|nr:type II toxin-antitoxin system HicB family antitoxin [Chloroflexota bacterium]
MLYQDENGAWIAEVPSLPGYGSEGNTREEAVENVKDALQLWIDDAIAHSEDIPEDYQAIQLVGV